jgi:hypothetical protein
VEFPDITYSGPAIDDQDLLAELPPPLAALLQRVNGFVAYRGGLHLRGACAEPAWHSLRAAWRGPTSFAARYPRLVPTDLPFAQGPLGDQFVLRDGLVMFLRTEFGALQPLGLSLDAFFERVLADPIATLELHPLMQFEGEGEQLQPGQLLSAYPPVCTEEARDGVLLRALTIADRLSSLAELAAQLAGVPEGATVTFTLDP